MPGAKGLEKRAMVARYILRLTIQKNTETSNCHFQKQRKLQHILSLMIEATAENNTNGAER